ncbi:Serine palmitoyltransferase 2 [Hyphodiscus hymeniophilus]|uniref:Serine palmitoyltransferase 2 n=1 Tax=Hyphodiscus hymeniophilus TaxID=353542 RepID=A0A9P7AXZ3_9HELO|nr:Serine palmitoyltransferase 2 [Hyphodiscus hymeniophilus]
MPVTLSRTWYLDDDPNGEWNLDYYAGPKPPSRSSDYTAKSEFPKTATKRRSYHSCPTAKLLPPSESTETPATTKLEDPIIDKRHILSGGLSPEEHAKQARFDTQFGPIGSHEHRYVSKHMSGELAKHIVDEPPYFYIITTHIGFTILIVFGRVRDFFGIRFKRDTYRHITDADGYAALNSDWSVPGRYITLMDRKTSDGNKNFKLTGTFTETLNLSSYNYLGFAQSEGPCADDVEECIKDYGISTASPRADAGTSDLTVEVERKVAEFVGKPDAILFSMGFSTNATSFSVLLGKGCLIISDELNHASIRVGARLSGATIRSYKHNDMNDLERLLREAIGIGQPNTKMHHPWRKIMVVVEGLFSMEGTILDLQGVLRLKKKYSFYLFVDEAHSIGALGPRGRGVCDYFDIDPSEVDILMGTFSKSFGANGGYIAATTEIIATFRSANAAMLYGESPAPPVLMQILSSVKIISGESVPGQGEERLQRIAWNSRYLRLGLKRLGFIVYGHDDSPVIPIILYHAGKLPAFSHEMLRRKIAIVIAGYPATPLISARARLCVSAAHNKEDMDRILAACDEIGDLLALKFSTGIAGGTEILPDGVTKELDDERSALQKECMVEPPRWTLEEVLAAGVRDAKMHFRPGKL